MKVESIDGIDYVVADDGQVVEQTPKPAQTHVFSDPDQDDHGRSDDEHEPHRQTPI